MAIIIKDNYGEGIGGDFVNAQNYKGDLNIEDNSAKDVSGDMVNISTLSSVDRLIERVSRHYPEMSEDQQKEFIPRKYPSALAKGCSELQTA